MKKNGIGNKLLNAPYIIWSFLFIVVPLLIVVFYTFFDQNGNFTTEYVMQLGNYKTVFLRSISYSAVATVICLLLAYPFAYAMTKIPAQQQKLVMMLIMLPMWINLLIRTYSWMNLLEKNGIINNLLTMIGAPTGKLIGTPGAVILGMIYNYLPYMILPIYTILSKLDISILEAAEDLGANGPHKFRRVILPNSMPGVVSGIIMVFVPCISTFYISQKLGNGKIVLIGDIIESKFQSFETYNIGAAISFILMIIILLSLAVTNRVTDGEEGNIII